jgi:hypothetical protein
MKKFLLVISLCALPAVCSAQISVHKPSFGVKRQTQSSPEVSLSGGGAGSQASPMSSNSPQTLTFNLTGMDESKGVTVDVGGPCKADKTPQNAGPGVYKVTFTFDSPVTSTDTCSVAFRSVANTYTAEIRVWVAATQTDPGVAIFGKANTIVIHTNTGQTIQAAVSMRQSPPGANMSILMLNTNQGTIMVTVIAPNKIQVNLNGCMLQGDVTGSSANTQPMAAMPACNGVTSATVQAK